MAKEDELRIETKKGKVKVFFPKRLWLAIKEHPVRHFAYLVLIYFALKAGKEIYAGGDRVLLKEIEGLFLKCVVLGQKFSAEAWKEVQNFVKKALDLQEAPNNPGELIALIIKEIKERKKKFFEALQTKDKEGYEFFHDLASKVRSRRAKNGNSLRYCRFSFVS